MDFVLQDRPKTTDVSLLGNCLIHKAITIRHYGDE